MSTTLGQGGAARVRPPRSAFLLNLTLVFVLIAIAGFSTTFFLPLARGTFKAPWYVYAHGGFMFGWLLLLVAQVALVRERQVAVHRRLGWAGAALTCAIIVSGVAAGVFSTRRDLAMGETWPYGAFVNTVIEMIVFGALVGAAIAMRRRPQYHQRFLLLATISALGPAWFRFRHFMPFVPSPIVTFSLIADSLLLVLIARDWSLQRKVHPVYVWGGGAMFAVHLIELAAAESALWLRLGKAWFEALRG